MAHSWCLISNCEEHQGLILLSTYYLNLYWSLFPFPIVLIPRYFLSCCWSYTSLSVQFSSVQLCPTICDPMNHSTPGLPVHHQLLEFTQTHVLWVGDAIQPSHPLLSPSSLAFNLSQHQGLLDLRTGHGTTDWFQIGKGVRQGCILSPCLFNFYAEYIVQNAWVKHKFKSRLLREI